MEKKPGVVVLAKTIHPRCECGEEPLSDSQFSSLEV